MRFLQLHIRSLLKTPFRTPLPSAPPSASPSDPSSPPFCLPHHRHCLPRTPFLLLVLLLLRLLRPGYLPIAPPAVGILAQHVYGYKKPTHAASASLEILTDRENATSLAKSLYTAIGIPMALCCVIYSFLYRTYPRDRE